MDPSRCPHCNMRLEAVLTDDGRTDLKCLRCEKADIRQAAAAKPGESSVQTKAAAA